MKSSIKSTKEEIKQKLLSLYSDSPDSSRNVLDFDKEYDFFSTDESFVLKFSSNWFWPEKYSSQMVHPIKLYQTFGQEDGGCQKTCWTSLKQESVLKMEKPTTTNNLTRDLEVLGKTPYQIGVDGEKFRVVAATLQKCNSPFIRRTFHFTSNGIVETSERKADSESIKVIPVFKQSKAMVSSQKFVKIRRFRVIKKNDLGVEKYLLPQKVKVPNSEKHRLLTVRIRPKNLNYVTREGSSSEVKVESFQPETPKTFQVSKEEKVPEVIELIPSLGVQIEERKEVDQINSNFSDADTSSVSLDPTEEEMEEKIEEIKQIKQEKEEKKEKNETRQMFKCESCGKQFLTYLSCLAHIRSHQRQVCHFCSKKFLTVRMLREHVRVQHQHHIVRAGTSEDRITTATSKFGRTRQVLNVAGLRSKYKML